MGDLDKFVNRGDGASPYEKIIVNPIEKDKKGKEPDYSSLKGATRFQILSALMSYFKKVLSAFSFKERNGALALDGQKIGQHILFFRKMLVLLSIEDQSHQPEFTQKLTELWHNLLDDCNSLSHTPVASSEILHKLNFFINEIQAYPPQADHTLGYYLTEYAGKEWIPFPFMELLQGLHEEFQSQGAQSTLGRLIGLLGELLDLTGIRRDS